MADSQSPRNKQPQPGHSDGPGHGAPRARPRQQSLPGFVLAAAAAAAAGLILFAGVIGWELYTGDSHRTDAPPASGNISPGTAQPGSGQAGRATGDDAPVSILPAEPEGVTIIEKQVVGETGSGAPAALAPVAGSSQIATGFAMDLGSALSFQELSERFANVTQANGPENFRRLDPRAVLNDTADGLEARLLVGPFENEQDATEACGVLILPADIACTPAPFEGELIPRE